MSSALDIINDAALFAGIGDIFNGLSAEESQLGLRLLNDLLDSETTQEYSVYNIIEGLIPVVIGVGTYTLGPAASLNVNPVEITSCTTVDSSSITHPMRMVGQQEWAEQVRYKPAPGRPEVWYYNLGAPTSTLYVWPTPAFSGDVLHVWYGAALQVFTNLSAVMVAPPGYNRFLKTNLGEMLAMWFKKPFPPEKKEEAKRAREFMRSVAVPIKVLQTNVPVDSVRPRYNIYTDSQ